VSKRLYRFFDQIEWAEQMMRGSFRFRTLAYYRDYEDQEVRGDHSEGTSVYRPASGLEIQNHTQRNKSVHPDSAFESEVKAGEIFVFCLSKSDTSRIREGFRAVACVEINNVPEFCRLVEGALAGAFFGGRPGHERVGHHVQYYLPGEPPEARWACPDLIACSKFDDYRWQDEFRLLFSFTDALRFENVQLRIVKGNPSRPPDPLQHHDHTIRVADLKNIATMHAIQRTFRENA